MTEAGDSTSETSEVQVNACFGDAGVLYAARACAFSRDLAADAQVNRSPDKLTVVCTFSRDETTGAQVGVSDLPVDDEQST